MTTKVKALTRAIATQLDKEIKEAMNEIAKEYGLSFTQHNGSFNSDSLTSRIEFNVLEKGLPVNEEFNDFKIHAASFGFKPSDLGRLCVGSNEKIYRLSGIKPSNPKNPIQVKSATDEKVYRTSKGFIHFEKDHINEFTVIEINEKDKTVTFQDDTSKYLQTFGGVLIKETLLKGKTKKKETEDLTGKMVCPECGKGVMKFKSSRRLGDELAMHTYKCTKCGYKEEDPVD